LTERSSEHAEDAPEIHRGMFPLPNHPFYKPTPPPQHHPKPHQAATPSPPLPPPSFFLSLSLSLVTNTTPRGAICTQCNGKGWTRYSCPTCCAPANNTGFTPKSAPKQQPVNTSGSRSDRSVTQQQRPTRSGGANQKKDGSSGNLGRAAGGKKS